MALAVFLGLAFAPSSPAASASALALASAAFLADNTSCRVVGLSALVSALGGTESCKAGNGSSVAVGVVAAVVVGSPAVEGNVEQVVWEADGLLAGGGMCIVIVVVVCGAVGGGGPVVAGDCVVVVWGAVSGAIVGVVWGAVGGGGPVVAGDCVVVGSLAVAWSLSLAFSSIFVSSVISTVYTLYQTITGDVQRQAIPLLYISDNESHSFAVA